MRFPCTANTGEVKHNSAGIRLVIVLSIICLSFLLPVNDGHAARSKRHAAKDKKQTACQTKRKTPSKHTKVAAAKQGKSKKKKTCRKSRRGTPSLARGSIGVPDNTPLMKIVPLEDRKYLLEPIENTAKKTRRGDVKGNSSPEETSPSDSTAGTAQQPLSPGEPAASKPAAPESAPTANREESYYERFTDLLVGTVQQLVGAPYKFGGTSIFSGIDCSGFVQEVFGKFAMVLPRSSREQAKVGMLITERYDSSKLKIGDILFFRLSPRSRQIGHTGIYIGDGKMIHAARGNRGVTVSSLDKAYYQSTFVAAKRLFVFSEPKPSKI